MINKNKKKIFSFFLALFIGGGVFFLAPGAHATIGDWAGEILGGLIGWIISALGLILVLVMKALVLVAQYSDFIHSPAVSHGWTVVRDVCNMFFVLVLLIIAFATILKIENYNYKKWLPKLILMAILINFSKTICGLLIDFAQLVMLTFVNVFKDIAAGNLITNLGITDILTLSQSSDKIGFWAIIGSYVLGLIYVLIALVVITTMLAMLVMRIVMIWIYVVLSPLAYLMSAFPGGQKYSSQWWSEFTKNLIVGPVLAFFIWLSFTALQAQTTAEFNESFKIDSSATTESVAEEAGITGGTDTTGTNASTPGVFIKFVIAIGMLIGGLKISQEIGGAAGGIAGKGMAAIQKGQAFVGKKSKEGLKALGGTAVMMTAGSKTGKTLLGNTAASKNPLLKYTGIRHLATEGLIKVNKKQKEIEAKAEEKMKNVKNTKVVARFAQEKAILPSRAALQDEAVSKMPSALGDPDKITKQLAKMSREDIGKLSDPEWRAIGASGAKLEGRALTYIQKNSDERGAYNRGARINGYDANRIVGIDSKGNPLPVTNRDRYGSYENPGRLPLHPSEEDRLDRQGKYETSYFKETPELEPEKTTKVEPDKAAAPRGNGNLSVNEFAREKSDTVAVDFDKLNVKGIEKDGDADYRNVRGLNTGDPALIKEVSAKMVGVIDQELNKIRSKGADNLTKGDKRRMENLETAKTKFSKPEAIDNLSMVNSSAASYGVSDVKTSKIHEEVHGLGLKNEDDTRYVTQQVLANKSYDAKTGRTDKNTVDQILAAKPANVSAQAANAQKAPVDDVLASEADAEEEVDMEAKTKSSGEEISIDTASLDKSMENFSKKLEEASKKFGSSINIQNNQKDKVQPNFVYLFNSLKKAINKQNVAGLAKQINIMGGDKASSPLEMEVISSKLSENAANQPSNINNMMGQLGDIDKTKKAA